MALTASTMMALGTKAPDFKLWEPSEKKMMSLDECLEGKLFVTIWFICNHCPYVKHVRHELAKLAKDYHESGVAVVAINSNNAEAYLDDHPAMMVKEKADFDYTFPYMYDEDQSVARAYQAACTPDFYVFGADRKLVYRGQFDGSRPGNATPVDGKDLRAALDLALNEQPIPPEQRQSLGCNIKWRPGNELVYFGSAEWISIRAIHCLKIPSLAKRSSTRLPFRLSDSAMFVTPFERRNPIAAFRIAAITSGPERFRIRLASSTNVKSRT